jgi:hypothetical protein
MFTGQVAKKLACQALFFDFGWLRELQYTGLTNPGQLQILRSRRYTSAPASKRGSSKWQ